MKKVLAMLVAVMLLASLTSCGTTNKGSASSTSNEIVIGSLQDISGPTSVNGKAVDEGVDFAANAINEQGGVNGKKIRVVHYDTKGNVQEAINAYNRLATQDKATAVVGPPVANIGIALAPISNTNKVPIVGGYLDLRATLIRLQGNVTPYTYMFRIQPSAPEQAQIMASYAMDVMHLKKFAIFYNQSNAYSLSLVQPFEDYVKSHGGQILDVEVYEANDKQFKTQLSKIKNTNPDAIYAPNYTQELVLFAQQARALGITVPFICGLDAAPPFASLAGDAANNVIFPNNISNDEPQLQSVLKAYKAKYGTEPINKFYLGYDSVLLIVQAIKDAKSTDPIKVAEAIAHVKNLHGMTGNITISPKTHGPVGLSMVMFEIQNGQYVAKRRYSVKD
ncbi:ABC transporter substrate-binding protein [Thermoanaerobacterium thermosaccharolyticum]|uniref:ABC transporter substrate-binding protein n=1 Tax=Thermoanaerobacterium thermosaccharolyticum TaxID=1517 RepID=UPI003DA7C460